MASVTSSATSPPRYFWIFLCLIIVSCLLLFLVPWRLWADFTDAVHLLPSSTASQSFSKTLNNSTIEELLHNISRQVKVPGVDCAAIFEGSKNETDAARAMTRNVSSPISDACYLNITENCDDFKKQRGYIMSSLTDEEEQFPIAYSILVYKDSEMVERLLRAIYRPQNFYCIHVDQKASNDCFEAITSIAKCFPNVFLASRRISVAWGWFTVLEPEIVCMEDLWKYRKWKYFINLTGQEFPLRTNHELVKILMAFQGAVDVSSSVKALDRRRLRGRNPPHGLRPAKGSVHIAANREFVDFVLHNQTSKDLLNWGRKIKFADETYFAMLSSNPKLGIKGTDKGDPENNHGWESFVRYKSWKWGPCAGYYVRKICILSTGDLPRLGKSIQMFANKFYLQEDRVVIGCLEEKIFNDTRDEYMGTKVFDTTLYQNATFIKNKFD
ncbi:unnamed protein product [Candidula unifasciata]|uniref:Beta-1,3-galactosyl-O-glycosyl-glycoprotein beta-1,6-N-acetylglucosaminyltransferase n=1 Tax=Candidula unifasciata TaxID=100452 RepID=A0A8S3Z4B1_9EUPU|nr:unnamed protein product [Candidula unifasciata]